MDNNKYFLTRRTVRRYSDRPVTDNELNSLIEEASHAPTTGNMQLYSVIVTRSEEGKRKLAPFHFNQPQVEGCQAVLTFCADFNRFCRWCEVSNAEPGYDNFQSFVTALLDTALFAQQFVTAAEMRGLGCCYLGTTTYTAPEIASALELPDMVIPVTTITVGWPEGEAEVSDRLPLSAFMHAETYHDPTDEEIRGFYADKEARPDSRRFVSENGKQTLAQVFTDVRYTRANNELFSRLYLDFITGHGFPLPG